MKPSEIADWFDQFNSSYCPKLDAETARVYEYAAATIRELEARDAKRIEAHQETLDRERVALAKLKIATEALEEIGSNSDSINETFAADDATQALARIKEV